MRRITSVALVVLVAFGAFAAADALGPESVPVASAVELHGEAPESGPPPAGFFIVPPRVVDMRDDDTPARIEDDPDEAADADDDDVDDADESDGDASDDDADDTDDADESDDEPDDDAGGSDDDDDNG